VQANNCVTSRIVGDEFRFSVVAYYFLLGYRKSPVQGMSWTELLNFVAELLNSADGLHNLLEIADGCASYLRFQFQGILFSSLLAQQRRVKFHGL
jgi:hypothetical protein